MVNSNFCQHGIVLYFWLSEGRAIVGDNNQFSCKEENIKDTIQLLTTKKIKYLIIWKKIKQYVAKYS